MYLCNTGKHDQWGNTAIIDEPGKITIKQMKIGLGKGWSKLPTINDVPYEKA